MIVEMLYSKNSEIGDQDDESLLDREVNKLQEIIQKEKISSPPIIVSHSLNTFLCQKYLESYPMTSLILINPLPPDPTSHRYYFQKLHFRIFSELARNSHAYTQLISKYYCCSDSTLASEYLGESSEMLNLLPSVSKLYNEIVEETGNQVTIEPESVPMFPVFISRDKANCSVGNNRTEAEAGFLSYYQMEGEDEQVLRLRHADIFAVLAGPVSNPDAKLFQEFVLHWCDATL